MRRPHVDRGHVAAASQIVGALRRPGSHLLAGALLCLLATSCAMFGQSTDDAAPARPAGPQAWTGHGLVLAACGASGMSQPTVELWEIDPVTGEQTGHRPAIEIPARVRLSYSCEEAPAVARRLFNHDFTAVAVQVGDADSDASRAGVLDLVTGQVRTHSRPPGSAFAPLPQDDLVVFDDAGRTLWYRDDSGTVVSFDPEAPSEDAWTEHGAFAGDDDSDASTWYRANARGLANPSGQVVASGNTLQVIDDGRRLRMFCTALFSGEPVTGDGCIASESATDGAPDVEPVAWLDDDTLLALDGPRRGAAANTVIRLEFDDDFASVTAEPALPPSDWLHGSVVTSLGCEQFATFARRGDDLAIFVQDLYAGDTEMPTTTAVIDTGGSEAPTAPSRQARLIDWVPAPGEETTCVP